jgi:uncharacterized protein YdaU (DUF1376 family)
MGAFALVLGIVDLVGRTSPEVKKLLKDIKGKNQRGRRAVVPILVKFMMLREESEISEAVVARIGEIANDVVKGDAQMRKAVTAAFLAAKAAKEAARAASSEEPTPPDIFGD